MGNAARNVRSAKRFHLGYPHRQILLLLSKRISVYSIVNKEIISRKVMRKLSLFCFILLQLCSAIAQNWTWAETAGGILPDEANGCAIDRNGNRYMSGFFFSSSIDFGHGNSISNGGICDGFIVKYDAGGNAVWASKVKGTGEDKATKCAVDDSGNVIITGYFDSPSIQFGGNNANKVSNYDGSGNTFDCFIAKYSAVGTPLWFHAIGETDDDGGSGVATDSSGNIFLTGWFRATSITLGSFTLYNRGTVGTSDMFVVKYNPSGQVLWARNAGSTDDDKGNGCAVDRFGNVIVTGYSKGDSIHFDSNAFANHGGKDAFVAKYNPNGLLLEAASFGGASGEEAFACSADANGNIFVAGNFSDAAFMFDTVAFTNTGSSSAAFLVKLNPSLVPLWAICASSNANDEARGCATDSYGNTVITGVFTGSSISFGNTVLNNNGGEEIFLVKYNPQGQQFWAKKVGKSKDDGSNDCAVGVSGQVVVAGYYNSSTLTFGNIDLDNSYVGISTSDVFIASTCLTEKSNDTQTACNSFTWIDGHTYTSNNNMATFSLPAGATNGCDSVVTLNLTILSPAVGTDTVTACDFYTWIDGITYDSNNYAATYHIIGGAANTCDSIVTLHLTIDTVDKGVTVAGQLLTAQAVNVAYRWLDCDNGFAALLSDTLQTFIASANGHYAVEIRRNNCIDTSACVTVNSVGIVSPRVVEGIKVYPNPNKGIVYFSLGSLQNVSIRVSNVNGQVVYQKENVQAAEFEVLLKVASGIYFAEVRTEAGEQRFKLVVQ